MIHFGDVPANSVLPIPFASYGKTNGESITLTGIAVTDVEIYKGTSVTQRASDNGIVLIDTDGIDIDTITGIHGFSIDLSDNSDASFYVAGSFYYVIVSAVTIDSQTVNFVAATFRIVAAESIAGTPKTDVAAWLGTAAAAPTVAGVPEVDVTHFNGTAGTFASGRPEVNTSHVAGTAQTAGDIVALVRNAVYPTGICIDTTNGAAGTTSYVNGTKANPCSTLASAVTIAAAVGSREFDIAPGSSITLASDYSQWHFRGCKYSILLNNRALTDCTIHGGDVSGTCTGTIRLLDCDIGPCTLPFLLARGCSIYGTVSLGAGTYHFLNCTDSAPSGSTATIAFGALIGNSQCEFHGWDGELTVQNLGATGTDSLSCFGRGVLTFEASCTGGTAEVAGTIRRVNNGAVTITETANVFPYTGDAFARLGAPAGASIAADLLAIDNFVDDIGVAGAGLTAIPDLAGVTTLLSRLSAARALLLDEITAVRMARLDENVSAAKTLTTGERDSIATALLDLANGIESGKTLREAIRLVAAVNAGKRSNAGAATEQYDAIGSPGTARVVGNLDAAGDGTPTLTP